MSTIDRNIDDLADDYVLGLLDPREIEALETEAEQNVRLRAAIAASRDRFVELDLTAAPILPSDALWSRIESTLAAPQPVASANAAFAHPANENRPAEDRPSRWRVAALSSMAATVMLAVALGWNLLSAPQPKVVAVLLSSAGEPLVLVEDFGNRSARVTPLTDFDVPDGRILQVWTLPTTEMGPVSLGLLERSGTALLQGPSLPAPREAQLYEITLEQAGGSPTGRPTGPILVKGFAKIPR